jgi:hypothetical protein
MKPRFQNLSFLFVSILCFNLLAFSASAQQSKKISVQGFLKDANGKAVADGSQTITFKLYTVLTGGTAAWTDTQIINVFGGVYSAHLGSLTKPIDNLLWGSETYYVGVTVQDTELSPRTELTFAPYSLGSPKAQEVVCSGAVGDVKYSILSPTQFAAQNGSCWVPMDGRSIAGSKLATITGLATVTNAGGLFLRGQEFEGQTDNNDPDRTSASLIATFQNQEILSHTHSMNSAGSHGHSFSDYTVTYSSKQYSNYAQNQYSENMVNSSTTTSNATSAGGDHIHSINTNGGNETRPKNLNLWTYIRIN